MQQGYDRTFVQRLRREVGDAALDVVWSPREKQVSMAVGAQGEQLGWRSNGKRGCWVVVKRCRLLVRTETDGGVFMSTRPAYIKVFKLNGKFGHPLIPGWWVIRYMCLSDTCRRGPMNRLRELNQWQQDALKRKYIDGQSRVVAQMASLDLRSALMKVKEELGWASHDREEHMAARAQMDRDAEAAENELKADIHSQRLL